MFVYSELLFFYLCVGAFPQTFVYLGCLLFMIKHEGKAEHVYGACELWTGTLSVQKSDLSGPLIGEPPMSGSLSLFSWDGSIPQKRIFQSLAWVSQGLAASISETMWGRGWRLQHPSPQHSMCVQSSCVCVPPNVPNFAWHFWSQEPLSYPFQKINL